MIFDRQGENTIAEQNEIIIVRDIDKESWRRLQENFFGSEVSRIKSKT